MAVHAPQRHDSEEVSCDEAGTDDQTIPAPALWGSLAGNPDDNLALTDPEKSYGYLIEQLGARILQTDQPAYLLDYLRKKGWHN